MQKFMAPKKTVNRIKAVGLKITGVNVVRLKDVIGKFLVLQKIVSILSIIFYLIWIMIGSFLVWFIIANFRLGAFDQLMRQGPSSPSQQMPQAQQTPEETTVPGVGSVNVNCVQKNLSEDLIIKMVQDKGTQNFTEDEKSKLAPCIIKAESPTDASSSTSQ